MVQFGRKDCGVHDRGELSVPIPDYSRGDSPQQWAMVRSTRARRPRVEDVEVRTHLLAGVVAGVPKRSRLPEWAVESRRRAMKRLAECRAAVTTEFLSSPHRADAPPRRKKRQEGVFLSRRRAGS